jgi:hypothetical protein
MSRACLDVAKLSETEPSFVCRIFKPILEHYAMCVGIRVHICHIDVSPADIYVFLYYLHIAGFDKTFSLDVVDASVFSSSSALHVTCIPDVNIALRTTD